MFYLKIWFLRACTGEHSLYCRLGQAEKFTMAEHMLANADHRIHFEEIKILSSVSDYYSWLYRESIEIYKRGSAATNRRGGNLTVSWFQVGSGVSKFHQLLLNGAKMLLNYLETAQTVLRNVYSFTLLINCEQTQHLSCRQFFCICKCHVKFDAPIHLICLLSKQFHAL